MTGALVGLVAGLGLVLILARVGAGRRAVLGDRVLRYVEDLPQLTSPRATAPTGSLAQVLVPLVQATADRLERVLGGSASIRRRLERLASPLSVHDIRVQQVLWGLVGLGGGAALTVLVGTRAPDRVPPLLVLTLVAGALGVMLRENRLTAQVQRHERQVVEELPAAAELLALAVAAGEGPVAALERVTARSSGALARDLTGVLAQIRTGTPVAVAFDEYAARTGVPVVARFAQGIAVAVERGTPLADVLHAQAGDVREAQRRALIESGARREIAMMVPVVFLVMPTTVIFAFWPGVVGLRLVTP